MRACLDARNSTSYLREVFEKLVWQEDRALLDGIAFRLESRIGNPKQSVNDAFRLYKSRWLLDDYEHFFAGRRARAENVLELGIWDGGSLALWFECLRPNKLVGIDLTAAEDSPYFRRYIEERGLGDRLKTYWRTDQADAVTLRTIVEREFVGPLDLVIDDTSHLYGPTRASLETLLPLVRPGGLYIVEDWAWNHRRDFTPHPSWLEDRTMSSLVVELGEVLGTGDGVIRSLGTYQGFVAIERGYAPLSGAFRLEKYIVRRDEEARRTSERPSLPSPKNLVRRLERLVRRAVER